MNWPHRAWQNRLGPDHEFAHVKLAYRLIDQDWFDEALLHCQEALRLKPDRRIAESNLEPLRGEISQQGANARGSSASI